MADGAAYTHIVGTEYDGTAPVWDWLKIPGVLARDVPVDAPCEFEGYGRTVFVGGAHVNPTGPTRPHVGGVVAMDFARGSRANLPAMVPAKTDGGRVNDAVLLPRGVTPSPWNSPDPTCSTGILDGVACCAKSCGKCGGPSCGKEPGGYLACCAEAIVAGNRSCNDNDPPCKVHTPAANLLTARRAWFLLDAGFISLSANISLATKTAAVTVALEQNVLDGAVMTGTWAALIGAGGGTEPVPIPRGNSSWPLAATGRWVSHRNISYVAFPTNSSSTAAAPVLRAAVGDVTGSWARISPTESASPVTVPVFKLWLDHGAAPLVASSSAYAVLPGTPGAGVAVALRGVSVVANTAARQVVTVAAAAAQPWTVMAAVYEAGPVIVQTEAGIDMETDTGVLLTMERVGAQAMLYFSSPVAAAGTTVTLRTRGLALTGGAGAAACAPAVVGSPGNWTSTITLTLPAALGATAVGSCTVAA